MSEEDTDEDHVDEEDDVPDTDEKEEERTAAVIMAEEGRGLIVQAEGLPILQLNIQPGAFLCFFSPVIKVVSTFLYRGRFSDYHNTFETTEEPDYIIEIADDAAVGVLQSKEWSQWHHVDKPLLAGTSLIFRISSQVSFKDKVSYSEVSVFGDVFVCDQLKHLVKVASVHFRQDDCKGNPVVSYVQRHGTPQGLPTPLANGGYTLAISDATFNAPLTNEPYSKVSGDFNPIHVNPYFSDFATLPDTITRGLWSSAATRRFVETAVARGHPDRV